MWVLVVFFPFVRMVCSLVGLDTTASTQSTAKLSFALAMFHTAFNVINTALLIGFIPQIEKIVCSIIKPKKAEEDEESRLQYIKGGLMKTPEISVLQAQKEIEVFGMRMARMFGMLKDLYNAQDDDATFKSVFDRIEKYEGISDNMENEIGHYLSQVGEAHLSDDTKDKIRSMLRQIGELESIGDSCYNLARIQKRGRENKTVLTKEQGESADRMFTLVQEAMSRMNMILSGRKEDYDISVSDEIEARINAERDRLKVSGVQDIASYESSALLIDLASEFEKTGDYVMNVVEARLGVDRNI